MTFSLLSNGNLTTKTYLAGLTQSLADEVVYLAVVRNYNFLLGSLYIAGGCMTVTTRSVPTLGWWPAKNNIFCWSP